MSGATMWIIVGAVVVVFFLIATYNKLVGRRNRTLSAFSTIDVLLKKRYDLIPNLVAAVQGYMTHERGVLERITELRSQALAGKQTPEQVIGLNNELGRLLGGLRVAIENYPQLRANENVLHLQASLNEVEEQLSAGRRAYNATALELNNALEMFPSNLVGMLFGFQCAVFFEVSDQERQPVSVANLMAAKP